MAQTDITLSIIKLVAGGLTAFLAIMLLSKTRDVSWMSLVAGFVTPYAGIVYDLMLDLRIISPFGADVYGITLSSLLFTVVPSIFFIIAFIIMGISKNFSF